MLLLCFPLALLSLSAPRDKVSFDFGWRFTTGLSTHPAQNDEPPPASADPGLHPAEAQTGYDDSGWAEVQLPHDGLIAAAASSAACRDGCSGKSYIPRHVLWYRKAFTLPAEWAGSLIFLDFEGSFRKTTVWLDGELLAAHDCGYTPFRVRLDNATSLRRRLGSGDSAHTIAVFVDPDNGDEGARSHGSGWWYEGGGLYRSVALLRVPPLHIERDGLFAYSNLSWHASGEVEHDVEQGVEQPSGGVLHASAAVANAGSSTQKMCVTFSLAPPGGGRLLAAASTAAVSVPPGGRTTVSLALSVAEPDVWSAAAPHLYTVHAAVMQSGCASSSSASASSSSSSAAAAATAAAAAAAAASSYSDGVVDAVSTTHGFRSLRYDADAGFFLNQRHFKVRGFCDHNSFAVVGMAVPPRVDLFRAQALRALGGNGRRMSHNPPATSTLDIYDRLGVVVMDENRLFANSSKYVANMGALVRRDRNHPSVVIWSFCNEAGCEGWRERGGPRFQEAAHRLDGTRPTLANMFTFDDLLSHTVDVQGFSHQSRRKLDACHARLPDKPIYMSECCSCNTFRDEDEGCETLRDNPHTACTQKSFNARCAESNTATNASDGAAYAVGTMVWTLFDYYGEPPVGGFEVSSSYGQYDLCGFPKAAASWYRTQWLLGVPDGPDKPFATKGSHEVHLVESWESPDAFPSTKGAKTRAIHAYSSAPSVELLVNGVSQGTRAVTRMVDGPGSYAEWDAVPWEAGELSAVAKDAGGAPVAKASRHTNGKPAALQLSVDAPSPHTGTGSALLLDGQDASLLRASIVDGAGRVAHLASSNVTFRVVSGPGRIQGTHNGDVHSHLPNDSPTYPAYHGLVRAVVRVTSAAGRPAAERALLAKIDVRGPLAAAARAAADTTATPIVVEASSPGFAPARVTIPTSTDLAADGVMAVAAAGAGKSVRI